MFPSKEIKGALVGALVGAVAGAAFSIAITPRMLFVISGAAIGSTIGVKVANMKHLKELGEKAVEFIKTQIESKSPSRKDTEFSLLLIINSSKLKKYIGDNDFTEKKITVDETKVLINQSSFFLINNEKSTDYDDYSDLPDPEKETDFIIRITGRGEFDISENKTKMGLRDSITSPECILVSMKKLTSADLSEEFIRSI